MGHCQTLSVKIEKKQKKQKKQNIKKNF